MMLPSLVYGFITSWILLFTIWTSASHLHHDAFHHHHKHRSLPVKRELNETSAHTARGRLLAATPQDIEMAEAIVKKAKAKIRVANNNRLAHPFMTNHTNLYRYKSKTSFPAPPPLYQISAAEAKAAALLAELAANGAIENGTTNANVTRRDNIQKRSTWWMANKANHGAWPFNSDSTFQVFRDVTDSKWATGGAARCVADGKTDCTAAINNAMSAGKRCGKGCNGSTLTQAILFFPAGSYLISSTIEIYFGTQMIGDAMDKPTIIASSSFLGLGMFSVDHYVENGGVGPDGNAKEWYINTANFYRQIRNFKFDLTKAPDPTDPNVKLCALHYQVGQATSLQNLDFVMTPSSSTQIGIFAENGSGGFMSDMTFTGGGWGIYGGSQQFTSLRMTFTGVSTGVQLIWDWGWSWKSIAMTNCNIGFALLPATGSVGSTPVYNTGSIILIDSYFESVTTVISGYPASDTPGSGTTGITIENVRFVGCRHGVVDSVGQEYLEAGTSNCVSWILGPHYASPDSGSRVWEEGLSNDNIVRLDNMTTATNEYGLPLRPYYERAKPQYEGFDWSSFKSVKSFGAKGDGVTDDTSILQFIINSAAEVGSIVYFDAGTYLITNTINVPANSILVGEAWAQLAASGTNFGDQAKPIPMLQVGNPGDTGSVEIQDLLFTSKGPTPGAILVEWNIAQDSQGSAGMWDCHARLGGAIGTSLTSTQCPPSTSQDSDNCIAGSLMMHMTESASAILENVWLWGADHDIDDPDTNSDSNNMIQCSIYIARGLLIESKRPTWLYGTASEHSVLYQYSFSYAANVYATMIQTESPYFQPTPPPPTPFESSLDSGYFANDLYYNNCDADPTQPGCDASWSTIIFGSNNINIQGAGLYSWFTSYDQSVCVDASNCQRALVLFQENTGNVQINNLITIGATEMVYLPGSQVEVPSKDNLAVQFHPFWSSVTAVEDHGDSPDDDGQDDHWDDQLDDYDPGPYTPCDGSYANLDDLANDVQNLPEHCFAVYSIEILLANLTASIDTYNNLISNGYAHYFGLYADAVASQADDSVHQFVYANGNKYFTCVVGESAYCCNLCQSENSGAGTCRRCFDSPCYVRSQNCFKKRDGLDDGFGVNSSLSLEGRDTGGGGNCEVINVQQMRLAEPCPPDYSMRGPGFKDPALDRSDGYENSIWWTLLPDKADQFYADLYDNTGIPQDKVRISDWNFINDPSCRGNPLTSECFWLGWMFGIPNANGYSAQDVLNPQSVVQKAIDNINNSGLVAFLQQALDALQTGSYTANEYDLVDAMTMPVMMVSQAVDQMTSIDKIGEQIEEEKRKAIILAFVSALLFFLPIAGEILGSVAETADIGAVLSILGGAGIVGQDIADIVGADGNDPLAIFDLILTPLSLVGDLAVITEAANIRRGMKADDITKLGKVIDNSVGDVKKICGDCKP